MKMVTIGDVAKRAGVSKSTISQYLNGRYEYMAIETKERIKKVIKELDYNPNKIARSLKQKKTTTIGVILANILYSFNTKVMRAIEDVCNESGYHVIICNADDNTEKEKRYIEMLLSKQVDGIIAMPTSSNMELYQKLWKRNFPLVFIDRILSDIQVSAMLLDNEKAAKLCVGELADNGYEKIAIMTMAPATSTPRMERLVGYKKAVEEYELYSDGNYVITSPIKEMQTRLGNLLESPNPPEALIAANDLTLMEILKHVRVNNLKVPKDLALIGIDEPSFADIFTPSLSTVAQPAFEIGAGAAKLLIEKIKGIELNKGIVHRFEPELIRRSSSVKA
ncbi:LacI family transcriptional regulator [Oceanobacillus arenosus]|uniref:LacI family transcriptional regulator n=1 Tax=Oceanobacillus arenosus TaxID=1229153 RepID=A0A3D8Q2M0_9BACI|nr:substrate-binding domain-containing protein [Oceanobacillus arenosus]RDW22157.1 LacI family transcriptional regulator [Oceanobacillus arenosus]